jgi:diguanylate cyclase (GGDEF)-like protein
LTVSVRRNDFVARLGGEEFALVLPERTVSSLPRSGERIRTRVAAIRAGAGPITVSPGGATASGDLASAALVDAADAALMARKAQRQERSTNPGSSDARLLVT